MPEEKAKRIFYTGYPGDQGTAYEMWGLRLPPRTVVSVSDRVYDVLKNIRHFHTVEEVKTAVIDFPPSSNEMLLSGYSGDMIASSSGRMS